MMIRNLTGDSDRLFQIVPTAAGFILYYIIGSSAASAYGFGVDLSRSYEQFLSYKFSMKLPGSFVFVGDAACTFPNVLYTSCRCCVTPHIAEVLIQLSYGNQFCEPPVRYNSSYGAEVGIKF